jgi:dihydroxyacetone kinase-like protein
MKKLMNDPSTVVADALAAFADAHSDLVRADLAHRLCLVREPLPPGRVALVSGGGSGHEPMHSGFVGPGMLAAAVLGDVFASPTADQVASAASAVQAGGGVLFVVKNYTGDVLNFRLAADDAQDLGIEVATVLVNDDIALSAAGSGPGRRGTAATLLVEKIAGAQAAAGADLATVTETAARVVARSRSLGVALSSCTTPMAGRPTFDLGPDELEFGVGIHGERGARSQALTPAADLADQLVDLLLADLDPPAGSRLLAFTNGLGATPPSELYVLHGEVLRCLRGRGHVVSRQLVGSYVTSLDMAGASVTLLLLDDELCTLWDAPVHTAALRWGR